jgi:hypothetical protein
VKIDWIAESITFFYCLYCLLSSTLKVKEIKYLYFFVTKIILQNSKNFDILKARRLNDLFDNLFKRSMVQLFFLWLVNLRKYRNFQWVFRKKFYNYFHILYRSRTSSFFERQRTLPNIHGHKRSRERPFTFNFSQERSFLFNSIQERSFI